MEPLNPEKLRQRADLKELTFETTDEIVDLTEFVGQSRALKAVHFGINIQSEGYHLYAMGPPGIGKHSIIRTMLLEMASKQQTPSDWCYVYNFEDPQTPLAVELTAGHANTFRKDMETLIEDLMTSIPVMLESDEYRARIQKIHSEFSDRQEQMLRRMENDAKKEGLAIITSGEGISILPVDEKGQVLTDDEFKKMNEDVKNNLQHTMRKFSDRLAEFLKKIPIWHKERKMKEKEAEKEFALIAIEHFIHELKKKYIEFPDVLDYFDAVQKDILNNVRELIKPEEATPFPFAKTDRKSHYQVNVLVDNSDLKGAPVIYEDHPSYQNLICRVEHVAQFGTLITDFTFVRPGALHKANGGYLILDAFKILSKPYAWDGLKRALFTQKIRIETAERMIGLMGAHILDPVPIPLDIKVVLLGERIIYYLLSELDPDFNELFKVVVDFEEEIDRNPENFKLYAQLIATLARKENLLPFHRTAVAYIIDHASRLVEDSEKLSTHMRYINDLVRESAFCATQAGNTIVQDYDVKHAIKAEEHRIDRVRCRIHEYIQRDLILVETKGEKIGEINALSVVELGDFKFGYPTRITATVRAGRGEVIDIQREVRLGGPIHSKGVLILSGFLSSLYLKSESFSLSASLVFEQTYGMVEGDSASLAELCVLLSALAETPISQALAITGSINQHGIVQAVGGLNQKIEGFFDVCKERGLTGRQGVLIPACNVKNLMLREDVVEAARNKKFRIYPVENIDQAITLLTRIPAGKRDIKGRYSKDSIHGRVERCLVHFSKRKKLIPKQLAKKTKRERMKPPIKKPPRIPPKKIIKKIPKRPRGGGKGGSGIFLDY